MDLYSLVILSTLFLLPSLFFLVQRRNVVGRKKLPPGPSSLPIIGNLHQLIGDLPHHTFQRLSNIYGPIMFLRSGSTPTLVLSSADVVKKIFKTHDAIFSGRPASHVLKRYSYDYSEIGFAPYGEHWREVRKLGVLEMLSARKVQTFQAVREEEVALLISSIARSDGPVNLSEMLTHLANDVICRAAFGRKYSKGNGIHALLLETQALYGGVVVADFFPWLRWVHKIDGLDDNLEKNWKKLDDICDEIIEEHLDPKRTKPEVEDFVDVMLRAQRDHILKIELTVNHMKGLILDMFIAGSDTSSATLVWAMTELIRNPAIMKKAQEEVRKVVGKKAMVEESDLPKLSYLKLTLKEALRLHPPAPLLIPRETTQKCVILGYDIPAKTRVFINAKAVMTDEGIWEKPQDFRPERFQDNPTDFKGQEYEFLPFGLGRRICPGINFAFSFTEIVLANLLHCFDWELPQGMERESVDMKEASGMVMHKKIPLCLVANKSNI